MSNGFYGLKVMPNLMKISAETPVLSAAYEIVINKKDVNQIIEMLEGRLARV